MLASRVAHVEAVEETHLFRCHAAGLKDAPERPSGESIERQIRGGEGDGIRIEPKPRVNPAPLFSKPAASAARVRVAMFGRGMANMLNGIYLGVISQSNQQHITRG